MARPAVVLLMPTRAPPRKRDLRQYRRGRGREGCAGQTKRSASGARLRPGRGLDAIRSAGRARAPERDVARGHHHQGDRLTTSMWMPTSIASQRGPPQRPSTPASRSTCRTSRELIETHAADRLPGLDPADIVMHRRARWWPSMLIPHGIRWRPICLDGIIGPCHAQVAYTTPNFIGFNTPSPGQIAVRHHGRLRRNRSSRIA